MVTDSDVNIAKQILRFFIIAFSEHSSFIICKGVRCVKTFSLSRVLRGIILCNIGPVRATVHNIYRFRLSQEIGRAHV